MIQADSTEEVRTHIESLVARVDELERVQRDHAQRFDTLQTPPLRRLLFWINGWPWTDLNATAAKARPWHKWWRP